MYEVYHGFRNRCGHPGESLIRVAGSPNREVDAFADARPACLTQPAAGHYRRGSSTVKEAPSPGGLSTVTVPPCALTSSATMARPMPLPALRAAPEPRQ